MTEKTGMRNKKREGRDYLLTEKNNEPDKANK